MKKNILLACLMTTCGIAAELPLTSPMGKHNQTTMVPHGWYLNGYHGYKPAPKIDYPEGTKVIHVSEVKGKAGFSLCHARRFAGKDGDKVIVTARVKGTGTGWFGLQIFRDSKWLAMLPIKKYQLTPEWKNVQVELPVSDVTALYTTNSFLFTFGTAQGAELFLSDLKIELKDKSGIVGSIPMPIKWDVFLPMKNNFMPTEEELRSIPAQLDGVKPRPMLLSGNEFDFESAFGGKKAGNCAWLFARINAERDELYTIGAGADWWMTIWVNGKIVIDTRKNGNIKHPARMTDFLAAAKLKKGENIIAVRYVTGTGSAKIALAGPLELKARGQKMRIVTTLCKDEFELPGKRSGNPKLIQGNPTTGLLLVTGQAVYKTVKSLSIKLPKNIFNVPDLSSGRYFAAGMRIQNFGRSLRNDSSLTLRMSSEKGKLDVVFNHKKTASDITVKILLNGRKIKDFSFPCKVLPADILFHVNASGNYLLSISSLVDSSFRAFDGSAPSKLWTAPLETELIFASANQSPAELVIDNYEIAQSAPEVVRTLIPLKLDLQKTFDPVKAGWKMVFSDEFDGKEIDWTKWECPEAQKKNVRLDGKGFLEIRNSFQTLSSGRKGLIGAALRTIPSFKYGYFESRVRFTQKPGWWSFCYLYAGGGGNPMLDGMEIDVYEDYYMAGKKGNKDGRNILDHNLHCFVGGILKSWNYSTTLPGKADDFYVIGCKWTPLEISYYLNGKLMKSSAAHSPHHSVTFDAVNHANGTAPLDYRIGAGILRNFKGEAIDEIFKADYVRIYTYPEDQSPTIKWVSSDHPLVVRPGEKFELEAEAVPSLKTGAALKGAYLLDSGHVIGYKSAPPYKFTVAITPEFYEGNAYSRGGRTGVKPGLGSLHVYAILIQDADGKAANTPSVMKFPLPAKKSSPYLGKAQAIPGVINPAFYDEGGNGVAYNDDVVNSFSKTFRTNEGVDTSGTVIGAIRTGEWIRITVDIKEAGIYSAKLHYGTPIQWDQQLLMLLDEHELGRFQLPAHKAEHWGVDSDSSLHNLKLPAGRHIITLIAVGSFNYGKIEFTRTDTK